MTNREQLQLLKAKQRELLQKRNDLQPKIFNAMEDHRKARVANLMTPSDALLQAEVDTLQLVSILTDQEDVLVGDLTSFKVSIDELTKAIQMETATSRKHRDQFAKDLADSRKAEVIENLRRSMSEAVVVLGIQSPGAPVTAEGIRRNYCQSSDLHPFIHEAKAAYYPIEAEVA